MSKFHFNSLDDANFKTKTKVVNGPITWGWDIEWCVKGSNKEKYMSNVGQMPIDVWCVVKSYEYNMGGWWKLVKIE